MGPLCIDKGSGSTPGIPSEWFFVCPRCSTIITDPQDGAYRPRNPGATRIGFHFPQLLSPRQTAASLIQKWERRITVKNFYNRVLGRPYTDPSTLPVTQAHLEAAQNGTLRWGPPVPATVDGVFMGIDQMGHENYVVIKARAGARMRLVHLEIIQSGDPWRRCGELMREYRVQTAAVEGLPNFNEAHRFAREHDSRVFVVHYGELENEILSWSDRPRDPAGVRRSDDEIRTPWTARVDQFKMMSWSLGKWAAGEVETPDARGRTQRLRTDRGEVSVMVCREVFWVHLQRVALLTEPVEGHEDERKVRSVVKKLGIDPHFAFANMLCDVAWIRRFGTEQILMTTDESLAEGSRKRPRPSPYLQQIMDAMPEKFDGGILDPDAANLTCGDCEYFDSRQGFCKFRQLLVKAGDPSCDCFDAKLGDDDEYP